MYTTKKFHLREQEQGPIAAREVVFLGLLRDNIVDLLPGGLYFGRRKEGDARTSERVTRPRRECIPKHPLVRSMSQRCRPHRVASLNSMCTYLSIPRCSVYGARYAKNLHCPPLYILVAVSAPSCIMNWARSTGRALVLLSRAASGR